MSRRTAKSAEWRRTWERDRAVRASRAEGFRSRAAYKLMEIDDSAKLFFTGARVADLGCAPGGWSQVSAGRVGKSGIVAGADILPMSPLKGVNFVQGDFLESETMRALSEILGGRADVVLSDMSPNLSGIAVSDQARAADLARAAVEFAESFLPSGGRILMKVFQGASFAEVRGYLAVNFVESRIFRPEATRRSSREVYILAKRAKK